jgi:hypothetical protein
MHVIHQQLIVREWPLKQVGDKRMFGYLVAVGLFPCAAVPGGRFAFADFMWKDTYIRYRVPAELEALDLLTCWLEDCTYAYAKGGSSSCYLFMELTHDGIAVLPLKEGAA